MRSLILKMAVVIMGFLGMLGAVPALAHAACDATTTAGAIQCGSCDTSGVPDCSKPGDTLSTTANNVITVLSVTVGAVAVIMIIVGGFRYVTASGNPENAKSARNTIVYAVIGLVIVVLAQLVVHFVLHKTIPATK